MDILNIEKMRQDKNIKDLAKKLTGIGTELFNIFIREKLTFTEVEQFTRLILPSMIKEKLDQVIMSRTVEDILKETRDNVKSNLS